MDFISQGKELHQLVQTPIHQDDLCRIGGEGRSATQRDGYVSFLQSNGVVDAVPDKTDLPPVLLQLFDQIGFILGQQVVKGRKTTKSA